jgi:hypothetical protein
MRLTARAIVGAVMAAGLAMGGAEALAVSRTGKPPRRALALTQTLPRDEDMGLAGLMAAQRRVAGRAASPDHIALLRWAHQRGHPPTSDDLEIVR